MDASGSHYVFRNDPIKLKSYVNQEVIVESCDGKTQKGWVHTIDPVSGSIVLVTFESGIPSEISIVLGHAVKSMTAVGIAEMPIVEDLDKLYQSKVHGLTEEELQKQKQKVKMWLLKHRIPVTETEDSLSIMDVLILKSPYGPDSCMSTNTIVLGKIQGLIKAMPEDVEEW